MLTKFTIITNKKGQQIKVRLNERKRIYTIIHNYKKYKTLTLTPLGLLQTFKYQFKDWQILIKSNSCYVAKKLKTPKKSKKVKNNSLTKL